MAKRETADVTIIGAGIVGCMVARELAKFQGDIIMLEDSSDVGERATKANSGIIHAGFHGRGGSLKGISCVQGNQLYRTIVEELDVPFRQTGALFVAFHKDSMQKLYEKQERARENGAETLKIITGEEARAREPRLSPNVYAAMVSENTGIISPFELIQSCARNIVANGTRIFFGAKVVSLERKADTWSLTTSGGERFYSRFVVNAAGEMAAILDAMVHPTDLVIRPRRGQFIVFDKQETDGGAAGIIRHVLYQAAESDEGGTLLAPTIDGNILIGPTSENIRNFKMDETTAEGLRHIEKVARKLIPDINLGKVISGFAGVRANITNVEKAQKDFIVQASAPGFISLLGIKNPGMTSAPHLALKVVELLKKEGLALERNTHFDPRTQGRHHKPYIQCPPQEQRELIGDDSSFGRVICRCEHITEGDVRSCLREELAPRTLNGVKRRLRVGMGRCQGSHCTPRIMDIMAQEYGCRPEDIVRSERGGHVVKRAVK